MSRFVGIIDSDGRNWGVRIPDLPGCFGAGPTPEAAIRDAISAMTVVATMIGQETGARPEARLAAEVMNDPAVKADMAPTDAFVMLPLVVETGRPARANISLDAGLLRASDEAAEAAGLTRAKILAEA